MTIFERYKIIQKNVEAAIKRSKVGSGPVTIMGASKDQSLNLVRDAAELGIMDMGENYAQELLTKAPLSLDTKIRWHFIGRLQSNKIKHILPYLSSVASVDSLELAERIGRVYETLDQPKKSFPIMLQVNQGSERQKAGLPVSVIESLFSRFLQVQGVTIVGLMTIPPAAKDKEKSRKYFQEFKQLFDRCKEKHTNPPAFQYCSMGMSSDYEIAIEEGSNLIRIGEALFGPRPKRTSTEED